MATTINANNTDGVVITPDTSGEIELQANGVTKAKVTANGLQDANGASLRGGSFRNLIINGDMRIAQRGTSSTGITGVGYYTVDRMQTLIVSGGTWTMSQDTDVPTGQGFVNSLKMSCTSATTLTANNQTSVQHRLEAQNLQHLKFGTSSAESLTLSFWVKSNKTGNYVVWFTQDDIARSTNKIYTINSADTWEKKTLTINGDASGVINNDNGIGMQVRFILDAGPDVSSGTSPNGEWETTVSANAFAGQTAHLADSTSNYINITGVQLEVGEGASDFEFLPYDVQLARCQRYFCTSYDYGTTVGTASYNGSQRSIITSSSGRGGTFFIFPVSMRLPPSVTTYSPATGTAGKIRRENDSTDQNINWTGTRNLGFNIDTSGGTSDCMIMQWKAEAEL